MSSGTPMRGMKSEESSRIEARSGREHGVRRNLKSGTLPEARLAGSDLSLSRGLQMGDVAIANAHGSLQGIASSARQA
jgi:hypothetical protein